MSILRNNWKVNYFVKLMKEGKIIYNQDGTLTRLWVNNKDWLEHPIVIGVKPDDMGYARISGGIYKYGKKIWAYAHRVIWVYFNGKIPNHLQINHKNGIKNDNRIENLEMVTPSQNIKHSFTYLNREKRKGIKSPMAKFTEADILDIRRRKSEGERVCEIWRDYNTVCYSHISNICRRVTWKHI